MAKLFLGNREVTPAIVTGGVTPEPTDGDYLVQVVDYDGTVLKSARLNEDDTFTLPSAPTHEGLVFDGWSSPVTITNNTVTVTNSDIVIGPMFHTVSGLSEFDAMLTTATGLSVTLNMIGIKDWGDGTFDSSTTHTYSSVGDYTITCDGSAMTTSSNSGLFSQTSSVPNHYIKNVRFGSRVTSISSNALQYCYSLTNITIPEGVTSIGSSAFQYCYSLNNITIPLSVTSIDNKVFYYCGSLTSITIPSSVTSIGSSAFQNCYLLPGITIPASVTSIGSNAFQNCYFLTNIIIPSGVTSIGNKVFYYCYSLNSITIPEGITSIGSDVFQYCYSLKNITIPSGVTSIGSSAFLNCYLILEYDFLNHAAVPTLSGANAFSGINKICKIKVPAALETEWKAASNWSMYADYIIGV